jgi:hypothetical protein
MLTVDWAGTSGIDRSYRLLIDVVLLEIIVPVSKSFDPNMLISRCDVPWDRGSRRWKKS